MRQLTSQKEIKKGLLYIFLENLTFKTEKSAKIIIFFVYCIKKIASAYLALVWLCGCKEYLRVLAAWLRSIGSNL